MHRGGGRGDDAKAILRMNSAIQIVMKRIGGQLREALRIWRRETDHLMLQLDFKVHER